MTYMSKEQLRQHLLSAPPGTTPGGIVAALRKQGVQMEGDPSAPRSGFTMDSPGGRALSTVGSFLSRVSPYAREVGAHIGSAVQNAASGLNEAASNFQSGRQGFGSSALQATGALAGGAAEVLASPVAPIAEMAAKPFIQSFQQNPGLIGAAASKTGEAAQAFSSAHPEVAANLKAGAQIASLPLAMASVEPMVNSIGGTVGTLGKEAASLGKRTVANLPTLRDPKSFEEIVSQGMEKGVKPQFRGEMKNSATGLQDYNKKAADAIHQIIQDKGSLRYVDEAGEVISEGHVPRNLGEFAQAIDQTKKRIFDQYSALTTQATGQGKQIDLHGIAQKLLDYADDPVKQLADKSKTEYARQVAADLLRHGKLDPNQTENLIKELNQGLAKAYSDKIAKGVSEVDMSIAGELRNQLDDAVLSATGQEYQPLKNAYGALKSIEKDVGHRALIVARQNVKTLPQLTDIFTGGDLLAGVITGNPALMAKGAAGKVISTYYGFLNRPDTHIMRMFSKASSLLDGASAAEKATALATSVNADDIPLSAFSPQGVKDAAKMDDLVKGGMTAPEAAKKLNNITSAQ